MKNPVLFAIVLFAGGCSAAAIQPPESNQAGLSCVDAEVPPAPKPSSLASGGRVNYYEPIKRTICPVTVEIDPVVFQQYSCYPQQSLTMSATPLASMLTGPAPERLELRICGASNLGPDPDEFVRPGPRAAVAEVGVVRAYQFGPDANGVNGDVGGPGVCYIGIYEEISVRLDDVREPERSRLAFGGYTYHEVEQRSAVECDAIVDTFR